PQDPDGAVEDGGREVGRADQLGHVRDLLVDRGLDAREGLRALLDRARLELHPLDVLVERADLAEAAEDPLDAPRRAVVEALLLLRVVLLFLGDVDDLLDDARVAARVLEQLEDLLEDDRVVGERLVDLGLALLDALRDADLALAVEQLDRAHLAQVHAHRVVGLLDGVASLFRGLGGVGRAAAGRTVRIRDDFDAQLEEALVDQLELLGDGRRLVREDRVDLLVEQIALLPTALHEQLDFGKLFLNRRQLRHPFRDRRCAMRLSMPCFCRTSSSTPEPSSSARLMACWSAALSPFKWLISRSLRS